jgi:hypothetical protein
VWPYEGVQIETANTPATVTYNRFGTPNVSFPVSVCNAGYETRTDRYAQAYVGTKEIARFGMDWVGFPQNGFCGDTTIEVLIPPYIPDGTYRIVFTTEYQVNPLSIRVEGWTSPIFAIQRP